ncbi:hypothetical protein T069G_04230 [Trichoderma breve]|uniref:Uncharacterized protein n=1 Tax=Trichoderma breve TaxID=2034170 RepID=A0A9W9EAT2_9HYPO|nr:hypothetical protein T069G_04230 [Trichoderma breve]KAJ4863276.1 hypothetical protein T069G_04230 [Trichoderma breve]
MKFLSPSALVLSLWAAGFASADFHIVEMPGTTEKLAVPSNKYNCGGIQYALDNNNKLKGAIGSSFMSMHGANLCGAKNLDFYKQSDGTYVFYIHNGDGSAQGQCFHNESSRGKIGACGRGRGDVYAEKFVCYTYFCNK